MKRKTVTSRSLRVRVAAYLMIPLAALALVLAIGGTWYINTFVTRAFDRVLAGSILSIAEKLFIDDGHVSVDIPSASLSMLSNSQHDSVFYNVMADGVLVTGYEDLAPPATLPLPDVVTFRNAEFRGRKVRIGMMLKPIYVTRRMALVQVAETTNGRDIMAARMLTALAVLGAVLGVTGVLLVWFAVKVGLSPMDSLRREVERRQLSRGGSVPPFEFEEAPREAMPLVSALNDLLAQLNHSMEVMRRFTADASHQLRTPIAILKTHLDLLDRQAVGSADWKSSRADIDAAVTRLDRLIGQLLALAAVEEGGAQGTSTIPVNVAQLAREIALDNALPARRRGIELSFEAPDEPLVVLSDPTLLGEVLRNLIDNAIRYNGAGGAIRVSAYERRGPDQGATACLEVEDDGPGIPAADRERVFERFYRVSRLSDPGGSGLGLAIVRAFVDRLGGAITLSEGASGSGLRATINLPLGVLTPESERAPFAHATA